MRKLLFHCIRPDSGATPPAMEIIRFERSSLCKLSLDWSGGLFELELTGAALVSARAEFCDVDTITGYMRGGDR